MAKTGSAGPGDGISTGGQSLSRDALRQRVSREALSLTNGYQKHERSTWSEEDEAILLVHLALIGLEWRAISHNMKRSPDSIRNKLARMIPPLLTLR